MNYDELLNANLDNADDLRKIATAKQADLKRKVEDGVFELPDGESVLKLNLMAKAALKDMGEPLDKPSPAPRVVSEVEKFDAAINSAASRMTRHVK